MYSLRKCVLRDTTRLLLKRVCRYSTYMPTSPAMIRVGDSLPQAELYEDFPSNAILMPEFVSGKNVVLFGVPGAFAPGCSKVHLPEYVQAANSFKKTGIDEVICVSVNDVYVMSAWGEQHKTRNMVRMFADPTGSFTYALGLGMNLPSLGGFRARRFSMVLVDNVIKELHVEPDSIGLCFSLAHVLGYKAYIQRDKNKLT